MRKAGLYTLTLLFVLALALGIFRAFVAWQDQRYLDSAQGFVAAVVEPLLREWDARYLRVYGAPSLLQSMPGEDLDRQVRAYSLLGPAQEIHGVESRLERPSLPHREGAVRAHFILDTSFANERAPTEVNLLLQNGEWKIEELRIVAPMLAE